MPNSFASKISRSVLLVTTEFFPIDLWLKLERRESKGKNGTRNIQTDRKTSLERCLLYLYCVSDGLGNDFFLRGTASKF